MDKLLIIDFFNLMHRAFHAYPKDFKTSKGEPTGAIFGFFTMFLTYLNKVNPTHVVVAYEDDEEPTFRVTEFSGYKANRTWAEDNKEEAELFYNQVPNALKILKAFNIPFIKCNGFEADDVAGTIAKKVPNTTEVIILSNDQDLLQLVGSNVKVLRPASPPFVKEVEFTKSQVKKKFGFGPNKVADYKGLRGDPSDNIPGVYGIGEKTAKDLLTKFNSIEDIYKNIEKVEKTRTKNLLAEGAEQAVLSKKLATIDTNCPIEVDLKKYKLHDFNQQKVLDLFKTYEFNSLIKKFNNYFVKEEPQNSLQPSLF